MIQSNKQWEMSEKREAALNQMPIEQLTDIANTYRCIKFPVGNHTIEGLVGFIMRVEANDPDKYWKTPVPKMTTPWEFVERYYPKYSSCNEILYNNDLSVLLEGPPEPDSGAVTLEKELWAAHKMQMHDNRKALIETLLLESNAGIYEKAIEGYINEQSQKADSASVDR